MKKIISILIFFVFFQTQLNGAEAGMPQLDPEYWASQSFWLIIVFVSIYFLISKVFIPKIKSSIDERENKIRKDLEEAKSLKEEAEKKLAAYKDLIQKAKADNQKVLAESRLKINQDILIKKNKLKETIEMETKNAEKEIKAFNKDSTDKIISISEEMTSNILKDIFGEDLNKSSIKATVNEVVKGQRSN